MKNSGTKTSSKTAYRITPNRVRITPIAQEMDGFEPFSADLVHHLDLLQAPNEKHIRPKNESHMG